MVETYDEMNARHKRENRSMGQMMIAIFLTVVLMIVGVLLAVNASENNYRERCREKGGVPVASYTSINCVTPDGRWIDVRE
jgi:hypothetical protein